MIRLIASDIDGTLIKDSTPDLYPEMEEAVRQLAEKGIRVNAVAPGVIDTAMTSVLSEEILDRQLRNADIPRKGTPQEVADVILYLASDRASYVTGQILRVDAGIG